MLTKGLPAGDRAGTLEGSRQKMETPGTQQPPAGPGRNVRGIPAENGDPGQKGGFFSAHLHFNSIFETLTGHFLYPINQAFSRYYIYNIISI
jgi:hypothetical protein